MSDYIYKPSAVKHFRRMAEGWRAQARELRKTVKNMERRGAAGDYEQGYGQEIRELTAEAEMHEKLGKELKELASDVLNGREPVL